MAVKLDLKNKIINGSFDFWQRGASFASAAAFNYYADRWRYNKNGTMVHTISQSTDVPTNASSLYSILIDNTTAQGSLGSGNYTFIEQRIEGNVLKGFRGKKMVLRFKVKATKTGIYSVGFYNAAANRSIVFEYTVNATDTWETKTVRFQHDTTGSWNYDTSNGMSIAFYLAGGSASVTSTIGSWKSDGLVCSINQVNACDSTSNNFQLTDIVLVEDNEGQTRMPDFQYAGRDFFEELQLCQRYYEKSYVLSSAAGSADVTEQFQMWCPTLVSTRAFYTFKIPKRGVPIMTFWNPQAGANVTGQWYDTTAGTGRSVDSSGAFINGFALSVTPAAINRVCIGHWAADAEL